jgi:phosphate transport system permease protein
MKDPVPNVPDAKPPAGEAFVWFTSVGLILGLVMVAALVGVIVLNGTKAFWPASIERAELADGRVLLGPLVQERLKPGTVPAAGLLERQYQIGLRERNGQSFAWVDASAVRASTLPADALALERMENGAAFLLPTELRLSDGGRLAAADPAFLARLESLLAAAADRRDRLAEVEKVRIGRINTELQRVKIGLRKAADLGTPDAELKAEAARLDADYQVLAAEARALREGFSSDVLAGTDGAGQPLEFPVASLVRAWEPNRLGLGGKLALAASRAWEFVSTEPREANTEGGVLPALFGTFAMTVLMSALVTPFGVIAAIYLREYARQGAVLRMVRISVNNLAGVPSIVFGVFGLGFFVYVLGGNLDRLLFADELRYNNNTPVLGTGGLLWASLTLALMTLPVVIVATEEALSAVPRGMREASLACGASKWQTIREILLPASAPGILTGVILAMARGAGEVAPLMIVGVVKLAPTLPIDGEFPFLHMDRKFMHLGFHIYDLGFQSPDSDAARPMVFASTLLLLLLVLFLNLGAIAIRNRLRERYKTSAF